MPKSKRSHPQGEPVLSARRRGVFSPRIVATNYLADDNVTWLFDGGAGFFHHRQTGFQTVDLDSCRSPSVVDGPKDSHYLWVCLRHYSKDVLGLPVRSPNSDPNRDFLGVTGDFGDYELIHSVDFKTNRIVLYENNRFYSALLSPDSSVHLSLDHTPTYCSHIRMELTKIQFNLSQISYCHFPLILR